MRLTRFAAVAVTALLCAAVATPALAHGYRHKPRVSLHFGFGAPFYPYYGPRVYAPYSYYPYRASPYYDAPVVVVPPAPTTYIEQPDPQAQQSAPAPAPSQAAPGNYWYHCAESGAYYPYVRQCAGQWQQVPPTPPAR